MVSKALNVCLKITIQHSRYFLGEEGSYAYTASLQMDTPCRTSQPRAVSPMRAMRRSVVEQQRQEDLPTKRTP